MRKMMGFASFDTTKDKKVVGANVGGVAKEKSSTFRQYMYVLLPLTVAYSLLTFSFRNRAGGFNRELSPPPGGRKRR